MKKILYITYDGLTDPLGQSQILPYLAGLSEEGYSFTILSFEKKEVFERNKTAVSEIIKQYNIKWVPLSFTSFPPIVSKFYDAVRMRRVALKLHRNEHFDMVHCRSYPASEIGLLLKRKSGVPFLFDMRGFWADEKRDGGAWPDSHPVFKRVYRYYKKKESEFVKEADAIISLTENGRAELMTWDSYHQNIPVTVIPCCADTNLFTVTDIAQKQNAQELLGIARGRLVLSYLGSVGSWYMLDEMLALFKSIQREHPAALFLFITHSDPAYIESRANAAGIRSDAIMIRNATRKEVPVLAKASDINISFIRPVYSKKSSSPTKLGEILSMGIPAIVNAGVGDVDAIIRKVDGGLILEELSETSFAGVAASLPRLLHIDPQALRAKAIEVYDLKRGVELYSGVYKTMLQKKS